MAEPTQKSVTIPLNEYLQLIDDREKLYALEGAGVDNWEGYDEARAAWREERLKVIEDAKTKAVTA